MVYYVNKWVLMLLQFCEIEQNWTDGIITWLMFITNSFIKNCCHIRLRSSYLIEIKLFILFLSDWLINLLVTWVYFWSPYCFKPVYRHPCLCTNNVNNSDLLTFIFLCIWVIQKHLIWLPMISLGFSNTSYRVFTFLVIKPG